MTQKTKGLFQILLSAFPISRIRRNHGLEHATLHILSERHPRLGLAGHSDLGGFWILGDVTTAEVESAASEGLHRMRAGEHNLAIHPNCGTNFVTSGTFAGLAALVAMFGVGRRFRDKLERVPLAVSLATMALFLAQPFGLVVQEQVTTSGDPGALELVKVIPPSPGRIKAHRIVTEG